MTAPVTIDCVDAIELAELLSCVADWLSWDHVRLGPSLAAFYNNSYEGAGDGRAALNELQRDLHRFAFLLGADTSHQLFGETSP